MKRKEIDAVTEYNQILKQIDIVEKIMWVSIWTIVAATGVAVILDILTYLEILP